MGIFGFSNAIAGRTRLNDCIVTKFGAARNDVDGLHQGFSATAAAEHLEGKLRHAVTEARCCQVLEHNIGKSAISRRIAGTLLRHHQAVGFLGLRAGIEAPGQAGDVKLFAIGPNAADAVDLAFAQGHREIRVIFVFGNLRCRTATTFG